MRKIHCEPNKAQHERELRQLLQIVIDEDVKSYLEIGVQRGLTFTSVGLTMEPGGRLVGVDMPGGPWGVKDGSGPSLIEKAITRLREHGQTVLMVWGDSRLPHNFQKATDAGTYDMVFIDGDHGYAGVKSDWENYGRLGRIVVFHDIDIDNKPGVDPARLAKYGTHTLWREIKDSGRKSLEIIDPDVRGWGIGVLWR